MLLQAVMQRFARTLACGLALLLLLGACGVSAPIQPAARSGAKVEETRAQRWARDAKRRQQEDEERARREAFMQRMDAHRR